MNAFWALARACWVLLALLVFGLLVQNEFAARIAILGVRPDLVLGVLVLVARRGGPMVGTLLGFAVGLMQDGLTPDHVGLGALLLCTVGFVSGNLRESIFWESPLAAALIVLLSALFYNLAQLALVAPGHPGPLAMNFLRFGIPGAVYTAVLLPALAYAVPRILRGSSQP